MNEGLGEQDTGFGSAHSGFGAWNSSQANKEIKNVCIEGLVRLNSHGISRVLRVIGFWGEFRWCLEKEEERGVGLFWAYLYC